MTPLATRHAAYAAGARLADTAGAPAVGAAGYAIPAGAVFVSTTGSDSAPGTAAGPGADHRPRAGAGPRRRHRGAARRHLPRDGHHQQQAVTIQNYPKEAVWLDGSVPVTGWVQDGTSWRHDGWTPRFDASVGFNQGRQGRDVGGLAVGQPGLPDGRPP